MLEIWVRIWSNIVSNVMITSTQITASPETFRIAIAVGLTAAVEAMMTRVFEELAEVPMTRVLEAHAHRAAVLVQVDSNHVAQVFVSSTEQMIQLFKESFPGETKDKWMDG